MRELIQDPMVPIVDVQVVVTSGIVELTGEVPYLLASERGALGGIAGLTPGVSRVDNQLRITQLHVFYPDA